MITVKLQETLRYYDKKKAHDLSVKLVKDCKDYTYFQTAFALVSCLVAFENKTKLHITYSKKPFEVFILYDDHKL